MIVNTEDYESALATWTREWRPYSNLRKAVIAAMDDSRIYLHSQDREEMLDHRVRPLVHATELGLMPVPNTGAIRKTYDWVKDQAALKQMIREEEGAWTARAEARFRSQTSFWDQGTWHAVQVRADEQLGEHVDKTCNTAMCFAGHACDMAGVKWHGDGIRVTPELKRLYPDVVEGVGVDREILETSEMASLVLGLHEAEAGYLYAGGNGVPEITAFLDVVFRRAGERLELV